VQPPQAKRLAAGNKVERVRLAALTLRLPPLPDLSRPIVVVDDACCTGVTFASVREVLVAQGVPASSIHYIARLGDATHAPSRTGSTASRLGQPSWAP